MGEVTSESVTFSAFYSNDFFGSAISARTCIGEDGDNFTEMRLAENLFEFQSIEEAWEFLGLIEEVLSQVTE